MDIGPPLIPHAQATEAVKPGPGALDVPAVPAQPLARLDASARDSAADVVRPAVPPAVRLVVAFVRVHLRRPPAGPARAPGGPPQRRDRLEHPLEDHRGVDVGGGEERREREPLGIDHQMALRARLAAIRWIRPGRLAPLFAGTEVESITARDQSIWSASLRRWSSVRSSRRQTPAACQSRKRRQQVLPLPHASSPVR
jgi:hypothetical protein